MLVKLLGLLILCCLSNTCLLAQNFLSYGNKDTLSYLDAELQKLVSENVAQLRPDTVFLGKWEGRFQSFHKRSWYDVELSINSYKGDSVFAIGTFKTVVTHFVDSLIKPAYLRGIRTRNTLNGVVSFSKDLDDDKYDMFIISLKLQNLSAPPHFIVSRDVLEGYVLEKDSNTAVKGYLLLWRAIEE